MGGGVLYLSYSGMLEPLGQSQVLTYQELLAQEHPVHIVSFERSEDWCDSSLKESVSKRMRAAGIEWHPLRYHKKYSLLATLWDIVVGTVVGWWVMRKHGLRVIHARSYVPAVMALMIKRTSVARFIFDMRGFWADERVEGGLWPPGGLRYRLAKWFERRFFLQADHVVSLTHAAACEIRRYGYLQENAPPITVIPTCADLDRFRPSATPPSGPFTLGYLGSVGTWYLFDAAVVAFVALRRRRPDARFLIINRDAHPYILECLRARGVAEDSVELRSATHLEVPNQIRRMHAGVFFIKPVFSKQASAPTKLAEFLGCGVPCLSNTGVGDMAQILAKDEVGIAVDAMNSTSISHGVDDLIRLVDVPGVSQRCVDSAQRNFSLVQGVERYRSVYRAVRRN
jgi:glycosyltransferase involved in cell wall biosynthesis